MGDNRVSNTTCPDLVAIGSRVEIRNLHRHTWNRGFQVVAIIDQTYLIRRLADGRLLPRFFAPVDIRVPHDALPAPDVTESAPSETFRVLRLDALVKMKLTSFRDKDRTHLRDMLDVGLIDETWVERLPRELAERLQSLIDTPEG